MLSFSRKNLLSAVVCLALGLLLIIYGHSYGLGSLSEPGSGLFPQAIGVVLLGCGIGTLLVGEKYVESNVLELPIRPLLIIPLALVIFTVMVVYFGVLPAVAVCTLVAAQARNDINLRDALMLSAGMVVFIYVIFFMMLGVQFDAIKWGL